MPERFALYYAPAADHPLSSRAAAWLGRDAAGGPTTSIDIPRIDTAHRLAISTSARRYGFHATIKAPMALAPGRSRLDLETALADFAATSGGAPIGRLKLAFIDGFLALIPERQTAELTAFAASVVTHFDHLRAPLSAADRQKRIATSTLPPRQVALLDRYGYPYVLDEFRFHMTLTDRLPNDSRAEVMNAAQAWFADAIAAPIWLDRIVLFHEPAPSAPFVRLGDFPMMAKAAVDA